MGCSGPAATNSELLKPEDAAAAGNAVDLFQRQRVKVEMAQNVVANGRLQKQFDAGVPCRGSIGI